MGKKITFNGKQFQLTLDKFLLLNFLQKLKDRFWGVAGLFGLFVGLAINFTIRTDLWTQSATISQFGTDPRTAPYFTASLFITAYGLWRWRNYLGRTTERPGLTAILLSITIIGLYLVAFMPLGWTPKVTTIHHFGFTLVGLSISATVIIDMLLYKTVDNVHKIRWQISRLVAALLIIVGFVVTALSTTVFNKYLQIGMVGELLIIFGFASWVLIKTYQGDCPDSQFSGFLSKYIDTK